jgi:hypothetical protein
MNPPSEELFTIWRDQFFENIEPSFLSAEIVDWCDDQFNEWLGPYYDLDTRPPGSEIVRFAWQINEILAEMEIAALSRANGD